jgi:hypothetical protein
MPRQRRTWGSQRDWVPVSVRFPLCFGRGFCGLTTVRFWLRRPGREAQGRREGDGHHPAGRAGGAGARPAVPLRAGRPSRAGRAGAAPGRHPALSPAPTGTAMQDSALAKAAFDPCGIGREGVGIGWHHNVCRCQCVSASDLRSGAQYPVCSSCRALQGSLTANTISGGSSRCQKARTKSSRANPRPDFHEQPLQQAGHLLKKQIILLNATKAPHLADKHLRLAIAVYDPVTV